MTEEILSDPESKTPREDGGEPGALQHQAKRSEVGDGAGDGGEERWKRERWTRHESMALVSAMKQLEEDASTTSTGGDAKWKSISQICSTRGVQRTSVQCRKRWNTLLAAYKKIKDWERHNATESYWSVGGLDCKAKKLPAGFDEEIWNVMNSFLAGRTGMSPRLFPYKPEETAVETIPASVVQIVQVPLPQPDSQRGKERKMVILLKRKRPGRPDSNSVPAQEPKKAEMQDDQNAGSQKYDFEAAGPLTHFLSSFLEKSLESFERNSELNRNLRREQGENLVAVLGSLSSAVRDLVHSSVSQK